MQEEEKEYVGFEAENKKVDLMNRLAEADKDILIKTLQNENARLRARLGSMTEGMLNILRRDSETPR
jgi:hypothetical protein